ncbi:MAG: PAS domain-containing protein [Anaerolineae bacterium]|nr:PAS domain-containing protein [Anaerolineae bacterium]
MAHSFNELAETVQQRENELAQLNASLEERVAERTVEITKLNLVAEDALRIFNQSHDMIGSASFEGYFIQLNPRWEEVLGYTADELKAQPFIAFVHPDDVEATLAEAARINAGASAISFVNRYRAKNGDYRWFSWDSTPDFEKGASTSVTRDITAEKQFGMPWRGAKSAHARLSRTCRGQRWR